MSIHMKTLEFTVKGQTLETSEDFSNIVRGYRNYVRCHFKFNSEWIGCKIIVVFKRNKREIAVPLELDKSCIVPVELSDALNFKMGLIGVKKNIRIVTNDILIEQEG